MTSAGSTPSNSRSGAMPLGRKSEYTDTYTPSLLYSFNRADARAAIGVSDPLPFRGEDVWWCYELGWLNGSGRPVAGVMQIAVPCTSPCIVESKSMKLYLNSFAQTRFGGRAEVLATLNSDLSVAFRSPVTVQLLEPARVPPAVEQLPGVCLDDLDVEIHTYEPAPDLLALESDSRAVRETLHTHLFRSLCPVTGQPDFATVFVEYSGTPMVRSALLAYLVSFRCHQAFHEATIERIYQDISERCQPEQLSVTGRFLRRGGVDINPFRSNVRDQAAPLRLPRQ
jgi:7-cyano-7-deazaguanine reductase